MTQHGWRQIQFHDRQVHFFPAGGEAVTAAACGQHFNLRHTNDPYINYPELTCKACVQAGAPAR